MPARLLDGAGLAARIREALTPQVAAFAARVGRPPGLGIVLAGTAPASEIYVRNKIRAAEAAGLRVDLVRLPATVSRADVLAAVADLNRDESYDGILVQTPLPPTVGPAGTQAIFDAIDPAKDVDGFSPQNVGRLVQNRPLLAPCTPTGIIDLLEDAGVRMAGAHAVVLGRSDIVGKPLALLLLHRDATVTICHSKTSDLATITASADILVAAIGRAGFVTPAFVRPGAVVVDVGINRLTDRQEVERLFGPGTARVADLERRGSIVVGDVHPEVAQVAGALTPVPGGVGPLTVAVLLRNTLRAAEARLASRPGISGAAPRPGS